MLRGLDAHILSELVMIWRLNLKQLHLSESLEAILFSMSASKWSLPGKERPTGVRQDSYGDYEVFSLKRNYLEEFLSKQFSVTHWRVT